MERGKTWYMLQSGEQKAGILLKLRDQTLYGARDRKGPFDGDSHLILQTFFRIILYLHLRRVILRVTGCLEVELVGCFGAIIREASACGIMDVCRMCFCHFNEAEFMFTGG